MISPADLDAPPSPRDRPCLPRRTRLAWLAGLAGMCLATLPGGDAARSTADATSTPGGHHRSGTGGASIGREGPWGILEWSPMYLEAPAALIESTPRPDQTPVWHFPGLDEKGLRELFQRAGLPEATVKMLLEPGRTRSEGRGMTVLPPVEAVIDLPAAARQAIYEVLARSSSNPYHEVPVLILDDLQGWLQGTLLSETQKQIWGRMLWRRGRRMTAFSDISVLIQLASTSAEITAARGAMTRIKTLTARVRRGPNTSAAAFADYWTAQQRNADVLPLIRAMNEREPDEGLNIVLLLPSLCRERLYTYPSLADVVGGRFPDCHWTALNFFSERPQPYFADNRISFLELTQNYTQLPSPSQLGDLICFVSPEGSVFHSCVYVADDVVFTKNGDNPLMPWVLMKLKTVAAIYDRGGTDRVLFFRQKPAAK